MAGELKLLKLIKGMAPVLNEGEYVFTTLKDADLVPRSETICEFKEHEGITIVLERRKADHYNLSYSYTASWITLCIHSSLDAVGLIALISNELMTQNIGCNVISGYYHDHLFVAKKDAQKALKVLFNLIDTY